MVIDFHTHIFPDKIAAKSIAALENVAKIKAATDGTLKGLLQSMTESGVDLSVILPVMTKPSQFESVNTFAAKVNETYAGKLISFGGIHPDCEDYKAELNKIKELGLKGVKIHPDYQKVMIDDIRYMNIIDYANEIGLIVITHAGVDIGLPDPVHCPPDRMRKVLDTVKPDKMVLAHYGGWKQWDQVYELLAGENVYLDMSFTFPYIDREMLLKILDKHDKKKFLFATDSPWGKAAADLEEMKKLPLSEEELEDILSGNAKQLLQLN